MPPDVTIEPEFARWDSMLARSRDESVFGHSLRDWFSKARAELGLDTNAPIVATGHQTLLWHPGILVKYLAVNAFAEARQISTANLVVDQHADEFGQFDIPVRRADGSLVVRRMPLTTPRKGVPMGLHEPFTPPKPPDKLGGVLPSVEQGVRRIYDCVYAHRDAASAARQMACALADLMQPWVAPMPDVTASDLLGTTFARALLAAMAADPGICAEHYNEAVRAVPESGIGTLLVRDDYVELPLWRIRDDGRRMHAYDNDVEAWLDSADDAPVLMPRALLLTALVRLGMCDLFVHGMGGAKYDRAMERWIGNWLGVTPSPIAMATATLRLPLLDADEPPADLRTARRHYRRLWHDPAIASNDGNGPSSAKASLLRTIEDAPRGSGARRAAFFAMHEALAAERSAQNGAIAKAEGQLERARIQLANAGIAARRDWAFPLYPRDQLDGLAAEVWRRVRGEAACTAAP